MEIKVGYMLPLKLVFVGKLESVPEWYASDPKLAYLKVPDDGMSVILIPIGRSGVVTVYASAFSAGQKIEATFDVDIFGSSEEPASIEIIAGDPQPIL